VKHRNGLVDLLFWTIFFSCAYSAAFYLIIS